MLNPRQILAFAPWQDVRFGSLADVVVSRIDARFTPESRHLRCAPTHVRFTPNSDRKSRHAQMVMSALPLKADMCGATRDVRFGPIADMCALRSKDIPLSFGPVRPRFSHPFS